MVASKNTPGSRTVLRQCPKTSRLIDADDRRPGLDHQHHLRRRHVGEAAPRSPAPPRRAARGRSASSWSAACSRPAASASTIGRTRAADGAGVGLHRLLGRLVPGHRRPEDEAPLVRVRQGPAHGGRAAPPASARRRPPPRLSPCPRLGRPVGRPLGLVGQRLVGAEDERARAGRRARRNSGRGPTVPSRGPGRWSAGTGRPRPPGPHAGGPRPGSPPSSPPAPAPGPSVVLTRDQSDCCRRRTQVLDKNIVHI